MKLPDFSVRRPVTVTMIFFGVVLLGFISLNRLPQELFPPITYPQITVVTTYENAAPEEIETLVSKPIEEAVGTVTNIKRVSSTSREGVSLVMAEFNWGTNMDFAALDVREKIDLIKERLPRESEEPIVMKYNPFDLPIMTLSVTGDIPPIELRETARRLIKDEIEKTEGVASAAITGGREPEISVEVDQPRLQASGISLISVIDALKAANLNYPAGTVKEVSYEYLIRTMGEFQRVEEIGEIPVEVDEPKPAGQRADLQDAWPQQQETEKEQFLVGRRLILLKEIAKVKNTAKEKTSISRYNKQDNVSLSIRKQSGANTLRVANRVRACLERLTQNLPKGVEVEVTYDQSTFIKESIAGVRNAAIAGGILAFLVIFIFLRDLRSSIVVATAIPISIMAVFSLMYLRGITLNIMSLGGLALGVGMLVDNAIVVIENIFRKRRLIAGRRPRQKARDSRPEAEAARQGANEVSNAIMASTLTTIAVFLPVIFVVGIAGQLFKQLAFTVTFSLLASLAVALSLIPVLSAGRRQKRGIRKASVPKQSTAESKNLYPRLLSALLKHKSIVLLLVLAIFLGSAGMLLRQDREFMPKVDQRQFVVKVDMSPGTKLEVTDSLVTKMERFLLDLPEVEGVTVNIGSSKDKSSGEAVETLGSHQAQIMVNLKKGRIKEAYHLAYRKRQKDTSSEGQSAGRLSTTAEVIQSLKTRMEGEDLKGIQIEYIAQESIFKTAFSEGTPIVIEIKGHKLDKLKALAEFIQTKIEKIPGIYGIRNTIIPPSPETKFHILKDRASLYNLSARDIALTAQAAIKGYVATKFKQGGQEIDVRVRLRLMDRRDLANLKRLLIHSPLGIQVPLSDVARLAKGIGPTEIKRLDNQRVILVTANIFGRSLNEVVEDIEGIIETARSPKSNPGQIPPGYSVNLGGEAMRMEESFKGLRFALLLAILLVYMIMAAQFESLWQPFIIIFTVPLSVIGVSWALSITDTPLNVVVLLGFIMLGGIVVNNGIIMIDYINMLRQRGMGAYEAVIAASQIRLRPILMTTTTTVLGLLPLALSLGQGAELRAPLAITVIGGLLTATFLTLVVVPTLYLSVATHLTPTKVEERVEEAKPPQMEPERPEIIALPGPEKPRLSVGLAEEGLKRRQIELLEYLHQVGEISRKDYADGWRISVATAARDLKEMVERRLIEANGPLGKGRKYRLTSILPVYQSTDLEAEESEVPKDEESTQIHTDVKE